MRTTTTMGDTNVTKLCKHHLVGLCRQRKQCRFSHSVGNCPDWNGSAGSCNNASCKLRHPATCFWWTFNRCKFKNTCSWLHLSPNPKPDLTALEMDINLLKEENKMLKAELVSLKEEKHQNNARVLLTAYPDEADKKPSEIAKEIKDDVSDLAAKIKEMEAKLTKVKNCVIGVECDTRSAVNSLKEKHTALEENFKFRMKKLYKRDLECKELNQQHIDLPRLTYKVIRTNKAMVKIVEEIMTNLRPYSTNSRATKMYNNMEDILDHLEECLKYDESEEQHLNGGGYGDI